MVSSSEMVSLPARPKTGIRVVLATVGVPPRIATAPPLTRILPAASRLTAMVLSERVAEHVERARRRQEHRRHRKHRATFQRLHISGLVRATPVRLTLALRDPRGPPTQPLAPDTPATIALHDR